MGKARTKKSTCILFREKQSVDCRLFDRTDKIAMDRDRAAGIDTRNKPARYAFYKVPFGQVEKVAGAVRQVLANNKDTEAKQIINPYYTTARNLSNVKHESYEIPKEELKTLYGIDLDKYPDALSKLSSNLHCSGIIRYKTAIKRSHRYARKSRP